MKTITFSDSSFEIEELYPRHNENVIPRSWHLVIFEMSNEIDFYKTEKALELWLQANTKHQYTLLNSFQTISDTTKLNARLLVYFQDENDALYTKLFGLSTILEMTDDDKPY